MGEGGQAFTANRQRRASYFLSRILGGLACSGIALAQSYNDKDMKRYSLETDTALTLHSWPLSVYAVQGMFLGSSCPGKMKPGRWSWMSKGKLHKPALNLSTASLSSTSSTNGRTLIIWKKKKNFLLFCVMGAK